MSRRPIALGLLAATAAALTAWLPTSASADGPIATAWWRVLRQQTPVGALPAAPVPDDGSLPVQNGPAGVLAVSALRYDARGATAGRLALTLTAPAPTMPAIQLCPARTPWTDGPDQEWNSRPSYDCAVHATGSINGSTVTWSVGSLLRGGELDVVIVPAPGDPTPYAVSFARPSASSLSLTASSSQPLAALPPPASPAPESNAAAAAGATPAAPAAGALQPAAAGAAPVVAPQTSGGVAQLPSATTTADGRPLGSRTLAAALLAAASVALLLRGLGLGAAPPPDGRSLLQQQREGAGPTDLAV